MKSKKLLSFTIGIIISLSSVSACMNNYNCEVIQADWNSAKRTFTIKKYNLEKGLMVYVKWTNNKNIFEDLSIQKSFVAGDSIISATLPEKFGDPLQGGNDGNGILKVSVSNGMPCGGCSKTFNFYNITNNAFIKSACLDTDKSTVPACPSGVFFDKTADSIKIYGTTEANCCGTHLASMNKRNDSILIMTKDTGVLCKCMCNYCFEIKVPFSYVDNILKFNNTIYKIKSSSAIDSIKENERTIISPNPATPSETITIRGEYASDAKVSITSVSGAIVGSLIPTVGADAMAVSLSGLNIQAGIYFVRIDSGEKVYSAKLCVK